VPMCSGIVFGCQYSTSPVEQSCITVHVTLDPAQSRITLIKSHSS